MEWTQPFQLSNSMSDNASRLCNIEILVKKDAIMCPHNITRDKNIHYCQAWTSSLHCLELVTKMKWGSLGLPLEDAWHLLCSCISQGVWSTSWKGRKLRSIWKPILRKLEEIIRRKCRFQVKCNGDFYLIVYSTWTTRTEALYMCIEVLKFATGDFIIMTRNACVKYFDEIFI